MSGFIILLASTAFTLAIADKNPVHLATDDFVSKQILVYKLLWHVDQAKTVNPEIYDEGKKWNIRENIKLYDNEKVVNDFLNQYNGGMLPRGEIFSVFYPHILEEAIALFRLFRSAIDFQTFYKTAAWARAHVNEGLFIYAFSVAVVHRPDTKYMRLPTPGEIHPYFFFNSEVIRQAHLIKMKYLPGSKESYVILANDSLWYNRPQGHPEHKLNYFVEDVGWNSYYYTLHLEFPSWMSSDEFNLPKGYRGEQYYYRLKLLLARYNLERLSNGLNEIEDIDWNKRITVGYHPSMTYANGMHLPHRNHDSMVPTNKYKHLREIQNLEARIWQIIDSGYFMDVEGKLESIYTADGLDILGNIIEGNADSFNDKLYGSVDATGRNILGFNPDSLSKHKILPSALQHFSTSLRDPAFYRLCKRIVGYFDRYKSNMEPYTPEQLGNSSGLHIESVVIDKLETYFDHVDTFINHAVAVRDTADAGSFVIKARQYGLNHKPFSYVITINAEKESEAVIRIFLGPKYNVFNEELDITENYANFYEFDVWKVKLTAGRNEIKRSSFEARFVAPDQEGADVYYNKLKMAAEKKEPLVYSEHVYGFPERLLLPKGRKEGLPLQIFVHVMPCTEEHISETDSRLWGKSYTDGHPMGYPLDRPVKANNFTLPNMHIQDVLVFHKGAKEINVST